MKPKELLRLVWINITQNKFKVVMTSIGIIVGAATIVMVIAIGKGGQADVADQFKNLNAGAVDISYDGGTDFGGGGSSDDSDSGMAMWAPGGGSGGGLRRFWRSTLRRYGRRFLIGRRGAGRITGGRDAFR